MLNRLKIGTKIGASFGLGLAFLTVIGLMSYQSTNELIENSRKEKQTYQVLGQLEDLTSQMKNAETGQRGYLITGEERYLEPYNDAIPLLDRAFKQLQSLTRDNSNQQQRLNILQPLIAQKLTELKETIALRRNQGFDAAQKVVLTNQGKELMDKIRKLTFEMANEERQLLQQRSGKAQLSAEQTKATIAFGIPTSALVLALIGYLLTRNISRPLRNVSSGAEKIIDGDLSVNLPDNVSQDEIGVLTRTFNQMVANLRDTKQRNEEQNWLKSNLAQLSQMLQGKRSLETVTQLILSNLAPLVEAQHGVFYVMDTEGENPVLKLYSSYAYNQRRNLANQFRLGEGLVGQCALEKQRILLTEVPGDYIRINSGLGEAPPLNIVVLPVLFETQLTAVIELASFQRFKEIHLTFLEEVCEVVGIALNTISSDIRTQKLLQESRDLAIELQNQQEELKQSNQSLEEQTIKLEDSQLRLRQQQEELKLSNEELQQLNEELEEKAELLEAQKQKVEGQNQHIELARQALEDKAKQLALTSKYKSEFLANMSHELRTPLNSLLILARLLANNPQANLTDKQVEYSRTIYSAGTDLLTLINDILDLAKIESGTLSLEIGQVSFTDLQIYLEGTFNQVAQNKGLSFTIELDNNLPRVISTDAKRLQQVLKNLLANALKFTEQGGVILKVGMASLDTVAFAVSDTGIGIPKDKLQIIFEAFQQADGTTSRNYGGTGLGLSISRELAQKLGGRIELVSQPGEGSTFTLYLPQSYLDSGIGGEGRQGGQGEVGNRGAISPLVSQTASAVNPIAEDRENIQTGGITSPQERDYTLLIIEDDLTFARILEEMASEQGFKVLVANVSKQGLVLAQEFQPDAITLDINMPEMDGWTVLDCLKRNSKTRHIPVHILSGDDRRQRGLELGAISYLQKPVSPEALTETLTNIKSFVERKVKNLLVIEDDIVQAQSIIELVGNGDVQSTAVNTAASALAILQSNRFDCIVMDLGLPDMSGFELIEQIKQQPNLLKIPIVVYTGKELTPAEETQLRRLAETIIIKDVRSSERLLDETALFLHRVQANLPQPKRQIIEQLRAADPVLTNKKILIVDDDVRNIFALTSLLESYQMQVVFAENGAEGIEMLQENPDINIILMDIMMPTMDGYETTRAIRQQPEFNSLPIIALTAKAMQGDREKCIEAGASDYITKPLDTEQLLSLMRVWLYQ